MQFTWYEVLSIIGAFQGLLLSIILFTRKQNSQSNQVLALFTLIFSLGLLETFAEEYFVHFFPIFLLDLFGGTVFLYGPLVYIYLYLLIKGPILRVSWIRHLSAFIAYILLILVFFLVEHMASIVLMKEEGMQIAEFILFELFFIHLLYYSLLSIRILFRHDSIFSNNHKGSQKWLRFLIVGLTILYLVSFIGINLHTFNLASFSPFLSIVQIGSVVFVYLLSYYSLLQKNNVIPLQTEGIQPKYQNSALSRTDKSKYLKAIVAYMDKEKPYLQPSLTIDDFAKTLNINRFYISQIINECLNKQFSDFVNSYRIEAFKVMQLDPAKSHLTILAIAFEAGFNSKTSFNTVFKKFTGMTPTEFMKRQSKH